MTWKYQPWNKTTPPHILSLYQQTETSGQPTKHSKRKFHLSKIQQFIHKQHQNKNVKLKRLLLYRITPQTGLSTSSSLLSTTIIFKKRFKWWKISNMQLSDINSKPHVRPSFQDLLDHAIGAWFYHILISSHRKIIRINNLHGPTHHQKICAKIPTDKLKCIVFLAATLWVNIYHLHKTTYNLIHEKRLCKPRLRSYYYV